jgi:hypothetical protein
MKNKHTFVTVLYLLFFICICNKTYASSDTTVLGIGTLDPDINVKVDIVSPDKPSLKLDSIPTYLKPKYFLAFDDSERIVGKYSLDSLKELLKKDDTLLDCDLDGKIITETFFWTVPTYIDQCGYWIGSTANSGLRLVTYDTLNFMQTRSVLTDWLDASTCHGRVKMGSNLLVNIKAATTSEQRIYWYPYGSLTNTTGTMISFTGQTIPVSPANISKMFYDGQYFLFSYKAGNNTNELTFSKYTFNGSSLLYVGDITFSPPASLNSLPFKSLTKGLNGFYYIQLNINSTEASISKYDSSGNYTGSEIRIPMDGHTTSLISIGGTIYIYYNSVDLHTTKKLRLF